MEHKKIVYKVRKVYKVESKSEKKTETQSDTEKSQRDTEKKI